MKKMIFAGLIAISLCSCARADNLYTSQQTQIKFCTMLAVNYSILATAAALTTDEHEATYKELVKHNSDVMESEKSKKTILSLGELAWHFRKSITPAEGAGVLYDNCFANIGIKI
jgi:hypothetical protein